MIILRFDFNHVVAEKLVDDQVIDSPCTLSSLSDNITATHDVIRRPGNLAGGRMPVMGAEISTVTANYLKLTMFMFNMP